MVTLKNRRTTTIVIIPRYPTTATNTIPTTLSIPTPITYEQKKTSQTTLLHILLVAVRAVVRVVKVIVV